MNSEITLHFRLWVFEILCCRGILVLKLVSSWVSGETEGGTPFPPSSIKNLHPHYGDSYIMKCSSSSFYWQSPRDSSHSWRDRQRDKKSWHAMRMTHERTGWRFFASQNRVTWISQSRNTFLSQTYSRRFVLLNCSDTAFWVLKETVATNTDTRQGSKKKERTVLT